MMYIRYNLCVCLKGYEYFGNVRIRWKTLDPHCLTALVNTVIYYQKNNFQKLPTNLSGYWDYLVQKGYVSVTEWEEKTGITGVKLENMVAKVACVGLHNWKTILKFAGSGKGHELCLEMNIDDDKPYGIRRIGTTGSYVHRFWR